VERAGAASARPGAGKAGEDAWPGAERRRGGGGIAHGQQERRSMSGRGAEEGEGR
jgi:hypothetical protein